MKGKREMPGKGRFRKVEDKDRPQENRTAPVLNAEGDRELTITSGKDETKPKRQLFMYVAILFGVAFLLILLSYIISLRSSSQTIDLLSESKNSAIQKIEQLQNDYSALYEENQELKRSGGEQDSRLEELDKKLEAASKEAEGLKNDIKELEARLEAEKEEVRLLRERAEDIRTVYETLWRANASAENKDYESLETQMRALIELGAEELFNTGVESQKGGSPSAVYYYLKSVLEGRGVALD